MSIYPAVAAAPAQQLSWEAWDTRPLLLALVLAPTGLFIAWLLGGFRSRSVEGPARVGTDEPVGRLWAVTFLGFFTWALVPAAYVQLMHLGAAATTSPSTSASDVMANLSPGEKLKMYILGQVCAVLVLLAANRATLPEGLRRLGLTPRTLPRGIMLGVLGILSAVPLTIAMSAFVQMTLQWFHRPAPQDHELIQVFRHADEHVRKMVVVSAALLAPAFEEVFFRGHVQTALAATLGLLSRPGLSAAEPEALPAPRRAPDAAARWVAIALVSALFASVHGINWMFAPLYVLSLCLGYAYERTANLWVPITMHAAFNILSLSLVNSGI